MLELLRCDSFFIDSYVNRTGYGNGCSADSSRSSITRHASTVACDPPCLTPILPTADSIRADFDKFAASRFVIGSQNEVVDQIGQYGELTGTNHLLLRVQWPGLDQKTAVRTLERLGRVVEQLN